MEPAAPSNFPFRYWYFCTSSKSGLSCIADLKTCHHSLHSGRSPEYDRSSSFGSLVKRWERLTLEEENGLGIAGVDTLMAEKLYCCPYFSICMFKLVIRRLIRSSISRLHRIIDFACWKESMSVELDNNWLVISETVSNFDCKDFFIIRHCFK